MDYLSIDSVGDFLSQLETYVALRSFFVEVVQRFQGKTAVPSRLGSQPNEIIPYRITRITDNRRSDPGVFALTMEANINHFKTGITTRGVHPANAERTPE